MNRRRFIKNSGQTVVATSILSSPLAASNALEPTPPLEKDFTVQEVIDKIMSQIPGKISKETVDTIKVGDATQKVTGIVSTFMATVDVINKAIWLGANFIITHEPTFYNHLDETNWLAKDPVYQYKKDLLQKNNIVVWRFHDFWHQYRPDGILTGFLQQLGWENYLDDTLENTCVIPKTNLKSLAQHIKSEFHLTRTFYIGDPDLSCSRVGILPGAWGGAAHIPFLAKDIDVLIVGESQEWEAVEYVRDASSAGFQKGLIIMGHARSEEPGMRYFADWLKPMVNGVQVNHINAGDPLTPV